MLFKLIYGLLKMSDESATPSDDGESAMPGRSLEEFVQVRLQMFFVQFVIICLFLGRFQGND